MMTREMLDFLAETETKYGKTFADNIRSAMVRGDVKYPSDEMTQPKVTTIKIAVPVELTVDCPDSEYTTDLLSEQSLERLKTQFTSMGIRPAVFSLDAVDMDVLPKDWKLEIATRFDKTDMHIEQSPKKLLAERVEETVFYGTGDEAYELWTTLCNTCYELWGAGCDDRAEIVFKWIEEDAKKSKEDANEYGLSGAAHGFWGRR